MKNYIFAINNNDEFVKDIIVKYNELSNDKIPLINENNLYFGDIIMDVFSDGEISPNYQHSIRGARVYLVCSGTNPEAILRQCLAIDAARRASAKEIVLVTPFFGYSRQDKKDGKRGSVGAKTIMNMYVVSGVSRIITVDLHADQIEGFTDLPIDHISGTRIFANTIIDMINSGELKNVTIASPDAGGVKRSTKFSKRLRLAGLDIQDAILSKHRDKPNSIESMTLIGDVNGRDVILVDDMIDTAGTLKKAAETLKQHGANKVIALASHGVLSGDAYTNIVYSHLDRVLISDTIMKKEYCDKIKVVSCTKTIAKFIKAINEDLSPLNI